MQRQYEKTDFIFEACVGKEKFQTHAEAVKAAENHRRRRKGRITSYRCEHCGKFHIGNDRK